MRVKLSIPKKQDCWFPVNEEQTFDQLKNSIFQTFSLDYTPSQVTLSLDKYTLLPHHLVKDILRENDALCLEEVAQKVGKKESINAKPSVIKAKKENKKKISKGDVLTLNTNPMKTKKERKKISKDDALILEKKTQNRSLPFQGLEKTKRRNLRRRKLKDAYRRSQASSSAEQCL